MFLKNSQNCQVKSVMVSLFNKVAVLRACNFIKVTPTQVLSCEICKFFKNNYFEEHLWVSASKLYLKGDYNTGVFLWTLLFKNTYFVEDLQTAGSETSVWGSLFNKVASVTAWKHLTVLETLAKVFLCEFCKFLCEFYFSVNFKKAFLQNTF